MEKIDLQKMCDEYISSHCSRGERPRLLLHACCAPCSSYVTEYLYDFFDITVYFCNPNISPREEYDLRLSELRRFLIQRYGGSVPVIAPEWGYDEFRSLTEDYSHLPEGGARCLLCYRLRLEKTARAAVQLGFPIFCSTLSVSPYKNAGALFDIGSQLAREYGIEYLPSDFKKKDGYKRSVELSREYGLYRQNYCGCSYSAEEAERRKANL